VRKQKKRKAAEALQSTGEDDAPAEEASNSKKARKAAKAEKAAVEATAAGSDSAASAASEDFRKKFHIASAREGQSLPAPVQSFDEAPFGKKVQKALKAAGFVAPSPIQAQGWPIAVAGQDLVAVAKTGSGKTLGFLLPAFKMIGECAAEVGTSAGSLPATPLVLVLAPTRELATQIEAECTKFGKAAKVSSQAVFGGMPKQPQAKALKEGPQVLVATPGRLQDLMEMNAVSLKSVRFLVLDEADRMLDMGFEPQIRKIIEEHGMPMPGTGEGERQTTMFSATFPQEMQDMALDFLDPGYLWIAVGRVGSVSSNVDQTFVDVTQEDRFDALLRSVEGVTDADGKIAKTLVFANMKVTVDDICWRLSENGIKAAPIHGGLSQPARDRAIANLKSGRVQALVATDVAARGLDLPGINHVVNYDLPPNADDYVHRIGRTGRIGNKGMATSMVGYNDGALKDIVTCLKEARQQDKGISGVPDWVEEKAFNSGGQGRSRFGRASASPPPF